MPKLMRKDGGSTVAFPNLAEIWNAGSAKVQRLDHMAQIGPRIIDVCTVADPVESKRAGGGGRRAAREFAVLEK